MTNYIDDAIIIEEMNKILRKGKEITSEYIPEDTFDLQNDLDIDFAIKEGNKIVGSIYIDPNGASSKYAEFVNYGTVNARNYYKNWDRKKGGSPFLTSANWAQFISKGARDVEDKLL